MLQDITVSDSSENLPQIRSVALIALGSNASFRSFAPAEIILSSIEIIGDSCGLIRGASDLFATQAFPLGSGPDFVNAAVALETNMSPNDLIARLHGIEAAAGRERRERWGQRSLDLDLLAMDALVLPDRATFEIWRDLPLDKQKSHAPDQLVLPHPRLQDRAFVLVPLGQALERAGLTWRHPVLGRSITELLKNVPCKDIEAVKPLQNSPFPA